MNKGKFIVFEGIDGSGKDTLLNSVYDTMVEQGVTVKKHRNLPDSDLTTYIRKILKGDEEHQRFVSAEHITTLYLAAMHEAAVNIQKDLDEGYTVLCSRWYYSTLAYIGETRTLQKCIYDLKPNIAADTTVIVLDVKPEVAIERIQARNGHVEYWEDIKRLIVYRDRYIRIVKTTTDAYMVRLDGTLTVDELTAQCMKLI